GNSRIRNCPEQFYPGAGITGPRSEPPVHKPLSEERTRTDRVVQGRDGGAAGWIRVQVFPQLQLPVVAVSQILPEHHVRPDPRSARDHLAGPGGEAEAFEKPLSSRRVRRVR